MSNYEKVQHKFVHHTSHQKPIKHDQTCGFVNDSTRDRFRTTVGFDKDVYAPKVFLERKMSDALEDRNNSVSCGGWIYINSRFLKTHFGLHNTLMTLSSLEIRNFWALCISYR